MTPAFVLSESTGEYVATRPMSEADIITQAREFVSTRLYESRDPLSNPADTRNYLTLHMANLEHEVFACLFWITGIESSSMKSYSRVPSTGPVFTLVKWLKLPSPVTLPP